MKEHPILFSTAMVQAILAGRKTQTRRIMKPQVEPCNHKAYTYAPWKDEPTKFVESFSDKGYWYCELCGNGTGNSNEFKGIKFPYGRVGDVLWVRETHKIEGAMSHGESVLGVKYKADNRWIQNDSKEVFEIFHRSKEGWRPNIFLPRAACRLYLQITDIRVERLNEIIEEDARAEGVELNRDDSWHDYLEPNRLYQDSAKASFQSLWLNINGPDSWRANPFVWVISFKKIDKPS